MPKDKKGLNPRTVSEAQKLLRKGPAAFDAAFAAGLGSRSEDERRGFKSLGPANGPRTTRD